MGLKITLLTALVIFLSLVSVSPSSAQVDVARQTTAITYPQEETVYVQFRGTTRFPRMKGEAEIRRTKKNITEIELKVSKMPRPFELGAGYATYILWAVSPEGQIDSLGEIKRRGPFEFDSTIAVTTRFQTFALILTAEPHFLVRQPSQAIMLENLSPYTRSGRSLVTTRGVTYFGNTSDYFRDARTPEIAEVDYQKTPSTILQALQALALARYAGAERDAPEELQSAADVLKNAQDAWKAGKDEEEVDILARQAISNAVRAEGAAIIRGDARQKRNERTRVDEELREADEKYSAAAKEIEGLKGEVAREIRNRELVERDILNITNQNKDLKNEIIQVREENTRLKVDVEAANLRAANAEKAKLELEAKIAAEKRSEQMKKKLSAMSATLRKIGAVSDDGTKLALTLPDSIWSGATAILTAKASAQIVEVAKLAAANPEFRLVIESHTDDNGTAEDLLALSQKRAEEIVSRLTSGGVGAARVQGKGYGAVNPISPNSSPANRSKNRRIHVFFIPSEQ